METTLLQSFRQNRSLDKQAIRGVMVMCLALDIVFVVTSWNLHRLVQFFTNWTLLMTFLVLSLSLYLHWKGDDRDKWVMTVHHVCFELAVTMNLVTVVVYWTLCHSETLSLPEYMSNENRLKHTYFVHAVPAIFIAVNFALSDIQMDPQHAKMYIFVGFIYGIMNCIESR